MGSGAYAGIRRQCAEDDRHDFEPSLRSTERRWRQVRQYGLAFQKVFLEGDERWRPLLVAAPNDMTTIK